VKVKQTGLYDQLEAMLSQLQMGDLASDHRAETSGYQGWNYVAITAVCKQAARALVYVYDDSEQPESRNIRKSLRSECGWNWRKSYRNENQGIVVDSIHPLVKLLHRPNPYQSGSSFRSEQLMQMRLHGSSIVWNRPNRLGTRTVQRYVIPMALSQPVPPGYRENMPRGGLRIRPTSYMSELAQAGMADSLAPMNQFANLEVPVENLTVVRYAHPFLRGDGMSPTQASSKWIDTSTMIDDVRQGFYSKGPNGQIIVQVESEDVAQVEAVERVLNEKLGPDGPQVVVIGNGRNIVSQRTAEELGFDASSEAMKSAILSSHHVSRAMVGDHDSMTYGSLSASLLGGTLLSVQPDMDQIADEDTLDLCSEPAYENQQLSIEYEVPSIEDLDLEEKRLDSDTRHSAITMREYRRRRGLPEFGDERDDMQMTPRGPVSLDEFLGKDKGGGGGAPWQFSHKSEIRKSVRGATIEKSIDVMDSLGDSRPLVSLEVDGTIFDMFGEGKPRLGKGAVEAIEMLKSCGCDVAAITSQDPDVVSGYLRDYGLDVEVNVPRESIVWDRIVEGVDGENRLQDLSYVMDRLPNGQARQELRRLLGKGSASREYGVVMLPLEGPMAEAVRAIGADIALEDLSEKGIESEPHVTVLYGLVEGDSTEVANAVRRMGAPEVVVGELTGFEAKEHGVPLVLRVDSQRLHDMNAKIKKLFAHVEMYPDYKPHITIAYLRPEAVAKYVGPCSLTGATFELETADVRLVGTEKVRVPLARKLNLPEHADSVDLTFGVGGSITRSMRGIDSISRFVDRAEDNAVEKKLDELTSIVAKLVGGMNKSASVLGVVEPTVAGLAIMAKDTGRVLMLQRALIDSDPAAGKWEFPGGHIEDGERPIEAAKREWSEEVGVIVPNGKHVADWRSGIYQGFVWLVNSESAVTINRQAGRVLNPDDPDGDMVEVVAWINPADIMTNIMMRQEVQDCAGIIITALNKACPGAVFKQYRGPIRDGNNNGLIYDGTEFEQAAPARPAYNPLTDPAPATPASEMVAMRNEFADRWASLPRSSNGSEPSTGYKQVATMIKSMGIDVDLAVDGLRQVNEDPEYQSYMDFMIGNTEQNGARNANREAVKLSTAIQVAKSEMESGQYVWSGGASVAGYVPDDIEEDVNRVIWAVLESSSRGNRKKQYRGGFRKEYRGPIDDHDGDGLIYDGTKWEQAAPADKYGGKIPSDLVIQAVSDPVIEDRLYEVVSDSDKPKLKEAIDKMRKASGWVEAKELSADSLLPAPSLTEEQLAERNAEFEAQVDAKVEELFGKPRPSQATVEIADSSSRYGSWDDMDSYMQEQVIESYVESMVYSISEYDSIVDSLVDDTLDDDSWVTDELDAITEDMDPPDDEEFAALVVERDKLKASLDSTKQDKERGGFLPGFAPSSEELGKIRDRLDEVETEIDERRDNWRSEIDQDDFEDELRDNARSYVETLLEDRDYARSVALNYVENEMSSRELFEYAVEGEMLGGSSDDDEVPYEFNDYISNPQDFASAVGAPDDAKVTVTFEGGEAIVEVTHKHIGQMVRKVKADGTVYNDYFTASSDAPKGFGAEIYAKQFANMKHLGFTAMEVYAAGEGDGTLGKKDGFVGYYAWPRLGVGFAFPSSRRDRYKHAFPDRDVPDTVNELMETNEGREWWYRHGSGVNGEFSTEEGSTAMRRMAKYYLEKEWLAEYKRKSEQARAAETAEADSQWRNSPSVSSAIGV